MRARPTRLAALTGVAALVITGAVGAVSTANAEPVENNLVVNIVDTNGAATKGAVILVPVTDSGFDPTHSINLDADPTDEELESVASTFNNYVEPGNYAVLAMTGWGGTICLGINPCSITAFMGVPGTNAPTVTTGLTVPETGTKTLSITSELPVLRGDGAVGHSLSVDFPAGFDEMQKLLKLYLAGSSEGLLGGIDLAPSVEWMSGGTPIDDASGKTYRPTGADVGKPVSANVNYNPLLATVLSSMTGGEIGGILFPIADAFTTNAITAKKASTAITLHVPKKVRKGHRAKAQVAASMNGEPVTGWAKIKVAGGGSDLIMVRRGHAQLTLAKLKPGKHKVTATLLETNVSAAAAATKTIKVKAPKHKKHKKNKKK